MPPGAKERPIPSGVWLSEIMLQQTTVAAVIPWLSSSQTRWPDVINVCTQRRTLEVRWPHGRCWAIMLAPAICSPVLGWFQNEHKGRLDSGEEGLRVLPGVGAILRLQFVAIAFWKAGGGGGCQTMSA